MKLVVEVQDAHSETGVPGPRGKCLHSLRTLLLVCDVESFRLGTGSYFTGKTERTKSGSRFSVFILEDNPPNFFFFYSFYF